MQRFFLSQPELRGSFQLGAPGAYECLATGYTLPGCPPKPTTTTPAPAATPPPAATPATAAGLTWATMPTWIKLAGGAVLAFAGYKLFIQDQQKPR